MASNKRKSEDEPDAPESKRRKSAEQPGTDEPCSSIRWGGVEIHLPPAAMAVLADLQPRNAADRGRVASFLNQTFQDCNNADNPIMRTLWNSAGSLDDNLSDAAWFSLTFVGENYFLKMDPQTLTAAARATMPVLMRAAKAATHALTFWANLCRDFIVNEPAAQAAEDAALILRLNVIRLFLHGEIPRLVPAIMAALLRKPESDAMPCVLETLPRTQEEDERRNITTASITCLIKMAAIAPAVVEAAVDPFVRANIESDDWRKREAALCVFGAWVENTFSGDGVLANWCARPCAAMVSHEMLRLGEAAAWALGRIFQHNKVSVLNRGEMETVVHTLVAGLRGQPRVAGTCAWAILKIGDALERELENVFESYRIELFRQMVDGLLDATECQLTASTHGLRHPAARQAIVTMLALSRRSEGTMASLPPEMAYEVIERLHPHEEIAFQNAAYAALASCMEAAQPAYMGVVSETFPRILARLSGTFGYRVTNPVEAENRSELQGHLCSVLQHITGRLEARLESDWAALMALLLRVLDENALWFPNVVHREALLASAYLAHEHRVAFEPFIARIQAHILRGVSFPTFPTAYHGATETLGVLCLSLFGEMAPFCPQAIELFFRHALDTTLTAQARGASLEGISHCIYAMKDAFDPWMHPLMDLILVRLRPELEKSGPILDGAIIALAAAFQGSRGVESPPAPFLTDIAPDVLVLFREVYSDSERRCEDICETILGALHFIAILVGSEPSVARELAHECVELFLREMMASDNTEVAEDAGLVQMAVEQAIQRARLRFPNGQLPAA